MITPPDRDAMLFLRSLEEGPWEPDGVAQEFANAVLEHWEFARPGWMAHPPEFQDGVYKGEFFRERFEMTKEEADKIRKGTDVPEELKGWVAA